MISRISSIALLVALQVGLSHSQTCTPCAQNGIFTEFPTFGFFQNATKTCTQVLEEMTAKGTAGVDDASEECKNGQLEAFQIGCCANAPTEYCPICPDGSEHERLTIVPIDGTANDPSCEVSQFRLASLNSLYVTGDCSDTILQRGAFYCGCPGTSQQCSMCPDGSDPPNKRKVDAYKSNTNCQGQNFLLSLLTADECTNTLPNLGVDYAAFCECPGYTMPDNGYDGCDLCDEGFHAPDDNKVHMTEGVDGAQFTRNCGQAKFFASTVNNPKTCEANLAQARSVCCVPSGATGAFATLSLMLTVGIMLVQSFF